MSFLHNPIESLKLQKDFKRVYKQGKYAHDALFVMHVAPNNLGKTRLGISISKKVGCAVVRNYVRRLVKENCRLMGQAIIKPGLDIIIVARIPAGLLKASKSKENAFSQVFNALDRLFGKLSVKI